MLQDDVALADVVNSLSEQLQQIQSQFRLQLAEQQAVIEEQQVFKTEELAVTFVLYYGNVLCGYETLTYIRNIYIEAFVLCSE